MKHFEKVENMISVLHYRHGIGDIKETRRYADGRIEIIAQGYGMRPHVRRGSIVYDVKTQKCTVKLYGRQLTAVIVG